MNQNPEILKINERNTAFLSYLSVLFGGVILSFGIWLFQKNKSIYIKFHSLQATFYNIVYMVAIVLSVVIYAICKLAFGNGGTSRYQKNYQSFPSNSDPVSMIFFAVLMLLILAFIVYGIYLGVCAFKGKYVKVPFIGKVLYKKIIENN
jgi:uncharacterized Tic20 family protein